jgi:molybdopterin synthase catalytic subunit
MQLSVRLFAGLRERAGRGELTLGELPEGLTMAELKRELERRHPELGSLAHVAGVVGTSYVPDRQALRAGDAVSLLPPVSGGAPSAMNDWPRACSSSPRAIDVERCLARVAHPSCGALASFLGTTRDTSRGQRVLRLEYEAFEAMTGPEMARIFARCRAAVVTAPSASCACWSCTASAWSRSASPRSRSPSPARTATRPSPPAAC